MNIKIKAIVCIFLIPFFIIGLAACSHITSGEISQIQKNEGALTNKIREENVDNLTVLEIKNQIGSIILKPSDGGHLKVSMDANVKATTKELAEELANRAQLNISKKGNKIRLKAVDEKNQKKDLFKLKAQKYRSTTELVIDYTVEVPANLQDIRISTNTGDIDLQNIKAAFDVNCGVGSIHSSQNIGILGNSNFTVTTGMVDIKLTELSNTKEVNAKITTGDINILLPQDARCTIETKGFMQAKEQRVMNGGGAMVKAKASMGNVYVTTDSSN
ncbi:hypothetical protein SAMN02745136_00694 [Anaerocolumna jejuensis DSM 15929]|uniref:DUF4097 domain-containing protein n=1 Tax=Anaerocolumna jejuensis DSM 15929 TaxID=1121322 RepID=A0A1M6L4W5_9FIRM|nr:DUF4097 family beta strand repeat-containing protein [Anaerocolumna jejuensis]SHJ66236.1 hypothetical protein SAMN02745136_00694 [Anaerocolumna jejuensis DSM 15929]